MSWIVDRLKEPSTYAGLAGIALALGMTAESYTALSNIAVALFGAVAVILAEKGKINL